MTVRDLKDSTGAYLKTVCVVYNREWKNSARVSCEYHGMQLYKFNYPDDETALLAYADSQWPMNSFWVEGGNTTSCTLVTNVNRQNFTKVTEVCNTANYFFCEYKSK